MVFPYGTPLAIPEVPRGSCSGVGLGVLRELDREEAIMAGKGVRLKAWIGLVSYAALFLVSNMAWAQDKTPPPPKDPTVEERVSDLEALHNATAPGPAAGAPARGTKVTYSPGDNAWLLTSSALVLTMTGPGLALFYGGLVRTKNVLSTFMHSMFLMCLVSMLWLIFGYSVAFGDGNSFFGNPMQYFMLKDVGSAPNTTYAGTIPHQTWMLFQLMFAIITPALISGAYAERIKFSAMVLFTVLWVTIIYFPLAHMVWGNGGLFNWALGGKIP